MEVSISGDLTPGTAPPFLYAGNKSQGLARSQGDGDCAGEVQEVKILGATNPSSLEDD